MVETWDIETLDCSRMIIHPRHQQLISFLEESIPSIKKINIKFKERVFNKTSVYRYVLLQYDPKSEIQSMHQLDWFAKKYQSVGYAGFKLKKGNDGHARFDKDVNDMVFGKNKGVNDLIVEFISWMNNNQWQYLVFLKESMNGFVRDALGRKINKHKSSQEYMKLFQDSVRVADELAHISEETDDFVSRFYYKIEQSRMAVRPEDYAKAIAEGDDFRSDNAYGVNYVIDQIKFLGEDEDKIEV